MIRKDLIAFGTDSGPSNYAVNMLWPIAIYRKPILKFTVAGKTVICKANQQPIPVPKSSLEVFKLL